MFGVNLPEDKPTWVAQDSCPKCAMLEKELENHKKRGKKVAGEFWKLRDRIEVAEKALEEIDAKAKDLSDCIYIAREALERMRQK